MNSTDPVRVAVRVISRSGEETLTFSGTGILVRDSRGLHLRYTARDAEGNETTSALHVGAGRALLDSGSSRLLLDPARPTSGQIAAEGGALDLTVAAHSVRVGLTNAAGQIELHYTLYAKEQVLREMQVTLAIRPMEME